MLASTTKAGRRDRGPAGRPTAWPAPGAAAVADRLGMDPRRGLDDADAAVPAGLLGDTKDTAVIGVVKATGTVGVLALGIVDRARKLRRRREDAAGG